MFSKLVLQPSQLFLELLYGSNEGRSFASDSATSCTGVGCHSLLQGIFLTQGMNPGLLHCRQMLYHPSHQGRTVYLFHYVLSLFNQSRVGFKGHTISYGCHSKLLHTGYLMEKAMASHSSTFAWKIPWTEEPGELQSLGSLESDMTERLHFHALEKEMATHSSVLAWRVGHY